MSDGVGRGGGERNSVGPTRAGWKELDTRISLNHQLPPFHDNDDPLKLDDIV